MRYVRNIGAFVQASVADGHGAVGLGGNAGVVRDEHDGLAALLEPAERFRRCADSDLQPVFPGSYLYIQMNSDLRNLPYKFLLL